MNPSHTITVQPMGFVLRVNSNSPAIIRAVETSFGRCGAPPPTAAPHFVFRFFEHSLDSGKLGDSLFRKEGHLLYQTTGPDSTLAADVQQGLAFGYFSPTTVAHAPFFRWHFLELAFYQMLEANGLMGVHASALVKNGRAVLLRAAGGGGKTTLAYAGARRNFQALAEDVVWLDNKNNCWWGIPWAFHLLPDARRLFSELRHSRPQLQLNGEHKLEVDLDMVRPGSTTHRAQPGPLVFLERRPGPTSRLHPIDPTTARQLWPAAQTGSESTLPHHQPYINTLLARPTYRLTVGDNLTGLETALDLLETLLKE